MAEKIKEKTKLNEAQLERKRIILQCLSKQMTTMEAALTMNLTQRAVQYNLARYARLGDTCFIHGNTGKKRDDSFFLERKRKVLDIFQNTIIDGKNPFERISYAYFAELLRDNYGIKCSESWIKKTLNSIGYKTPNKYKAKKEEIAHLFRPPKECFGELVQADGTPYDWFGDGHQYCIQGFVDDATGIPVGLYMTKHECLLGYIEATRNMAQDYGLPKQMYPDRASVFFVSNTKSKTEKRLTQYGKMMERLGIDMFPAYSPQAKGRIERFWKTLQGRLPIQFKLHGIKTIEAANEFLQKVYIPKYIKRFAKKPKSKISKFVKADMKEVNAVLKATFPAKTDRAGVFQLMGYRFFCPDLPDKKINICLNERDGLWVTPEKSSVKYSCKLIETDTTGRMPEVMQLLIERVFLKNAKPKFREVYIDIDQELLDHYAPPKKQSA